MKQGRKNDGTDFFRLVVCLIFYDGWFVCAFVAGQFIVKLLLIKFASHKRIDDGLWRLGTLLEIHYGELKENETITIHAKRFTATITRTPEPKGSLIKKIATNRLM